MQLKNAVAISLRLADKTKSRLVTRKHKTIVMS